MTTHLAIKLAVIERNTSYREGDKIWFVQACQLFYEVLDYFDTEKVSVLLPKECPLIYTKFD